MQEIESRFLGYCITDQDVNQLINDADAYKKTYDGSFILLQTIGNYIYISQDFVGNWGLYLFKNDNYFAISNSFFYLVEKIKNNFKITPDIKYMKHYMLRRLASESCKETMINEIELLPRYVSVVIDKEAQRLSIYRKSTGDETLDLDSAQGIEAVDRWYYRWTNFIRNLSAKTDKIEVDLSGGMDSRLTFLLFLKSGIDLSKISIHSLRDELHTHKEDYEIASEIAEAYGFELNKPIEVELIPFSTKDTVEISFYTKLECHKQMYFKFHYTKEPVFTFSGAGGEAIRKHDYYSMEEAVSKQLAYQNILNLDYDFISGVENIVNSAAELIYDVYGDVEGKNWGHFFYKQGRMRYHFGKDMVENYLSNRLRMTPLLDSDLHRIRYSAENGDLLMAVIFTRYCPQLIDFKFDHNRSIEDRIIEHALEINKKYPFQDLSKKGASYSDMNILTSYKPFASPELPEGINRPARWCMKIFYTDFIKQNFCHIFPERIYDYAIRYMETHDYFSLEEANAEIAIAKIFYDTEYGQDYNELDIYDFFNTMSEEEQA